MWAEFMGGSSVSTTRHQIGRNKRTSLPHLEHHDVALVVVSRAPQASFEPYRKRMGWHFKWVSSNDSDFNRDYHVSFTNEDIAQGNTMYNYEAGGKTHDSEAPGISVFYKDERGDVFHTFVLCSRRRPANRHVQLSRPHAEGSQRGGRLQGLGAATRRI